MSPSLFIARRYLFSRRRKTVVNLISWISLTGIAVGAMALIMVLSVYNGIGRLTQSLFDVFDPPLLIEPAQGKTLRTSQLPCSQILALDGVEALCPIVEENAWVTHGRNQAIVSLRGTDQAYGVLSGLDTLLSTGRYVLGEGSVRYLVMGGTIAATLGLQSIGNGMVMLHIPHRGGSIGLTMDDAFNSASAYLAGTFYIQQDLDSRYVVADADMVRELMGYSSDECTALALMADPDRLPAVRQAVRQLCGPSVTVRDRFEQQPLYYKIFRSERLGVILILSLIVLISTLSLVASLSLLIIDKQRDILLLRSLGMTTPRLRRTFFLEGAMISATGVLAGILAGFAVCFLQQRFGLIKMGDGNFVVSAFPVEMHAQDFLLTFLLVMGLSLLSVALTVRHRFPRKMEKHSHETSNT